MDTSKWGADFDFENTGGVLSEASQALQFSSSSSAVTTRVRSWILQSPGYGQDWELTVDVVNNRSFAAPSDGASMGIAVQNPLNNSQVVTVEIYAENGGQATKGFLSQFLNNGSEAAAYDTPNLGVVQGRLRLTFDNGTKLIRAYYRTTADWVQIASYGS